ncbi:FAS1 domain-containing protein [Aspergillus granulosus]|uniref:FAS1 domain-containing protein n=1 Tax=Aspergillus granulosus TaxID=176169 RepID=A0ABR4H802_9EURO
MKATYLLFALIPSLVTAIQDPLSYRSIEPVYTLPKPENVTTLLDFIASRSDLSQLHKSIQQSGGFEEAFDTNPTWKFTFFAPNDEAFNNTGRYFKTFEATPKGKWWLGNTIIHHYVPNSILQASSFNETYQRFQTGTYLFVGAEKRNSELILNNVARVVESDIPITNGVVHIIDRILEPSAQVHEADLPWLKQTFIAGSCSNPALPYC